MSAARSHPLRLHPDRKPGLRGPPHRRPGHRLRDCPVGRAGAGQRLQRPGGAGHEGCRPGRRRPAQAIPAGDSGGAHRADLDRPWPGARAVEQHARLGERPRHAHPGRDRVGSRGPPARHPRRRPRHRIGGAAGPGGRLSAAGARAPAAVLGRHSAAALRDGAGGPRLRRRGGGGAARSRGPGCRSSASSTTGARSSPRGRAADVRGHWSTAPAFVAGARLALERFRRGP